jgi:hypothetical protein
MVIATRVDHRNGPPARRTTIFAALMNFGKRLVNNPTPAGDFHGSNAMSHGP